MPREQYIHWSALATLLGGLSWLVVRPLVAITWNNPVLGLTYEGYNRLMVVPLGLLLLGTLGLRARYARQLSGWAGRGFLAQVGGLLLMLAGVAVEFYFAGGVNTGDWIGSVTGWLLYLLGSAATLLGLLGFGAGIWGIPRLRAWSPVPLTMGVVGLLWLPAAAVANSLGIATQVFLGLGWMALGYLLWTGTDDSIPGAQ